MKQTLFLLIVLTGFTHAFAREPDDLEDIQRELRIVSDVFKSALRDELRDDMRVTSVDAQYLAQQGVLLSVTVNTPYMNIGHDGSRSFEIDGRRISIPQIPSMVEDILQDLQIDITPYEPEALEELRDLRSEQRELRLEQREIRSDLRSKRRDLVRAEDRDKRENIQEDIDDLERELTAIDAQYDALAADIDGQYQRLRDYRDGYSHPESEEAPEIDTLIARTVCDYGGTLKSLKEENYLTVALQRGQSNRYYAFRMNHVDSCSNGNMKAERLLELGYLYDG